MASSDKPIYQFTEGVVAEDTLFPISYQDNGEYKTGNISAQSLGESLSSNFTNNNLNTSNKTLIGGINELLEISDQTGISVKGTLDAGETELVLESPYIKEDSLLDFYTSIFGVNPTAVETEEGSITLTFPAQETDLTVEVIIRGEYKTGISLSEWHKIFTRHFKNLASDSNDFTRIVIYKDSTCQEYTLERIATPLCDTQISWSKPSRSADYVINITYPRSATLTVNNNWAWAKIWISWIANATTTNGRNYPHNLQSMTPSDTSQFQFLNLTSTSHPYLRKCFPDDDTTMSRYDFYINATWKEFFKINLINNNPYGVVVFQYNSTMLVVIANDSSEKLIQNGNNISLMSYDSGITSNEYTTDVLDINITTHTEDQGYMTDLNTRLLYNTYDIEDGNGNITYSANCTLADLGIV